MARPKKCRKVCRFPKTGLFVPGEEFENQTEVILAVDEYETLRLIDKEGFSQEQCCEFMGIARTTVQQIYACARKKVATALVDGRPLRIEGGDFQLCDGQEQPCGAKVCFRQTQRQIYHKAKGEHTMRIAVTYENGQVFQHFGHTEQFKVYDIEEGKIVSSEVIGTDGNGHGALADLLYALHVDALICGGIGGGAQAALTAAGIKWYGGVSGAADAAVEALLSGELEFDPQARCDHHDHHHDDGACGSHGCGEGHHCG